MKLQLQAETQVVGTFVAIQVRYSVDAWHIIMHDGKKLGPLDLKFPKLAYFTQNDWWNSIANIEQVRILFVLVQSWAIIKTIKMLGPMFFPTCMYLYIISSIVSRWNIGFKNAFLKQALKDPIYSDCELTEFRSKEDNMWFYNSNYALINIKSELHLRVFFM